jgi:hypothetical protein
VRSPERKRHGLSPEQISRVVMRQYPSFRECYLDSDSSGRYGRVTIEFKVEPDGHVSVRRAGERLHAPDYYQVAPRVPYLRMPT